MSRFDDYSINQYKSDLDEYGLDTVWDEILTFCLNNSAPALLQVENFGELYEIGLAHVNKTSKKEMGKYFTPSDVADVMADWLINLQGENICDVCCGTGNLILSYLKRIGLEDAHQLLTNNRIFLYDIDELALKICRYAIAIVYGKHYIDRINYQCCDFLDQNIILPPNCKAISNPPYYKIQSSQSSWIETDVIKQSKELYSAIMEKILEQSAASVIITPFSFISGDKFYSLRKKMNTKNGFIVSFDNVPGSIFNGKKHGIFNTNNANSVRAAITVTENKKDAKGFRISPLIRFQSTEREQLLSTMALEMFIPNNFQTVDENKKAFYKCHPSLTELLLYWQSLSNKSVIDILSKTKTEYPLCIPNSCRYFTVATVKDLERQGKHTVYCTSEEEQSLLYCLFNSSFAYWHWRLYDGGITYPLKLLHSLPIFFNILTKEQKEQLCNIAKEMQNSEKQFLTYKKNAGVLQENVKFPSTYRNQINRIFLEALNAPLSIDEITRIHANNAFSNA